MVPWLNYDEILDRQRLYDLPRFKNEVLGIPSTLGDHIVTRQELEACCENYPMATSPEEIPQQYRRSIIAGLDWGGGGTSRTVLVLGFMRTDFTFQICRMERFSAQEDPNHILTEVARRCQQFGVRLIGADGGGSGHVYNRLLLDKLPRQSYSVRHSLQRKRPGATAGRDTLEVDGGQVGIHRGGLLSHQEEDDHIPPREGERKLSG